MGDDGAKKTEGGRRRDSIKEAIGKIVGDSTIASKARPKQASLTESKPKNRSGRRGASDRAK